MRRRTDCRTEADDQCYKPTRSCASTYISGPPTTLFDDMATSWTGWSGSKDWHAIDGHLSFTATITSLRKVTLVVETSANSGDDTLKATLKLDAGGLDRIAHDVRSIFRSA
ncbi:DUF6228 family protein [Paraburkholderia caribensis]|uniref:DUF6228 family protein n=1 Tax=Paraburkholderia caribensis TaxID=75105 RepID=UPI003AB08A58